MQKYLQVIVDEAVRDGGFMAKLRENEVDEDGFERLAAAIRQSASELEGAEKIDRLLVACLYELPVEIENTVEHYTRKSPDVGRRVNRMAETLRELIQDLLWQGLEEYYQ